MEPVGRWEPNPTSRGTRRPDPRPESTGSLKNACKYADEERCEHRRRTARGVSPSSSAAASCSHREHRRVGGRCRDPRHGRHTRRESTRDRRRAARCAVARTRVVHPDCGSWSAASRRTPGIEAAATGDDAGLRHHPPPGLDSPWEARLDERTTAAQCARQALRCGYRGRVQRAHDHVTNARLADLQRAGPSRQQDDRGLRDHRQRTSDRSPCRRHAPHGGGHRRHSLRSRVGGSDRGRVDAGRAREPAGEGARGPGGRAFRVVSGA